MSIIGEGSWRYDFQRDWANLPRWWNLGETGHAGPPRTSVQGAVAANGDVYVLCRAAHPVLVFDAERQVRLILGRGQVFRIRAWAVDRPAWQNLDRRCRPAHRHPARAGRQVAADARHPNASRAATFYGQPFNMPTGTAFTSDGDVFVSDGYGNRRVHRFGPDGTLKNSWGEHGTGPGQFVLVHFIARRPAGPALRLRPRQSSHPIVFPGGRDAGGVDGI